MNKKLVMLAIMDGYGITDVEKGNAIKAANKPNLDRLFATCPNTILGASGEDVGLPDGQMGNSEVGHMNIGAGRVVYQSLTRVNIAVRNKTLDLEKPINEAINRAIRTNHKVHIMGLLSDGGVHSHIDHIVYLLESAVKRGAEVVVHGFLDGRDVPPRSAGKYFEIVQNKMDELKKGKFGVISGRYYAMDRDKNYDRVQKAYDALVYGVGPRKDLFAGLEENYNNDISDEFVVPYIVNENCVIEDGDSVIFANFRPDRAIEMSVSLTNPDLTTLVNPKHFQDLYYVSMMLYSDNVLGQVVFPPQELNNTLGEVLADRGLKQLRIAETEKYAHVTYFFDGGVDKDLEGATRVLVPSPKVATYDLMPEMSAYEVTEKVLKAIKSQEYDVIILNYANCDMVGHTTVFDSTVKAVETVDECIGKVCEAISEVQGVLLVTADHGNADKVFDENGNPFSAHTTNPVPFIIFGKDCQLREGGNLGDIAPTMLELLGESQPSEMTGKSLIKK